MQKQYPVNHIFKNIEWNFTLCKKNGQLYYSQFSPLFQIILKSFLYYMVIRHCNQSKIGHGYCKIIYYGTIRNQTEK